MKSVFIHIVFLFFSLSAFAQADSLVAGNNVLSGKWRLIEFKDVNTGIITDSSSVQNGIHPSYSALSLQFYDTAGLGEMWGTSFCNDVGGYYRVYKNNKLSSSGIGGTDVNCLYESKFTDAMHDASGYKRKDDTLCILYNHDSDEMLFVVDKRPGIIKRSPRVNGKRPPWADNK